MSEIEKRAATEHEKVMGQLAEGKITQAEAYVKVREIAQRAHKQTVNERAQDRRKRGAGGQGKRLYPMQRVFDFVAHRSRGLSIAQISQKINIPPGTLGYWSTLLTDAENQAGLSTALDTRRPNGRFPTTNAIRAAMLFAKGLTNAEVAKKLGMPWTSVAEWRQRFDEFEAHDKKADLMGGKEMW